MNSKSIKVWLLSTYQNNEVFVYNDELKRLEKYLGINIDVKTIPWNRAYDIMIKAFKNGSPPDVLELGSTWISIFAHLGYLKEVPSYFKIRPSLSKWMDDCSIYKGIRYSIPWFIEPVVLATNQDFLEKHNIDYTDICSRDILYDICREIFLKENTSSTQNEHIPFGFTARPDPGTLHFYMAWLYKEGYVFPNLTKYENNLIDLNSFVETFKYIVKLMNISSTNINDPNIYSRILHEKFYNKNKCTFLMDTTNRSVVNTLKYKKNHTVIPVPAKSPDMKAYAGGALLNVSSTTKYPNESWEIVKHLTSDSFIEKWAPESGNLPAFHSPFWDKHLDNQAIRTIYSEIINSKSYSFHPLWRNIELVLSEGIFNIFWFIKNSNPDSSYNKLYKILNRINKNTSSILNIAWEMKYYD
ncbi:MAG: extracellular solute-binding protein [Epulopiscium sp.]|nr:extracellular solute-binding protein [Candidatus Epulonipiscium sp.]